MFFWLKYLTFWLIMKHMIPRAEQSSVSNLGSWILVFLSAFNFAPFAFGNIYKYFQYLFDLCPHSNIRLWSNQKPQLLCNTATVILSSEQAVDFAPPQPSAALAASQQPCNLPFRAWAPGGHCLFILSRKMEAAKYPLFTLILNFGW